MRVWKKKILEHRNIYRIVLKGKMKKAEDFGSIIQFSFYKRTMSTFSIHFHLQWMLTLPYNTNEKLNMSI